MEYEIHVTVRSSNIDLFINDCKSINVKPIVIETEKDNFFNNQVMTSSKHCGENCLEVLDKISSSLTCKGYEIIRKKIEIRPLEVKNDHFIYYESHLRLKLDKQFDCQFTDVYTNLRKICKELNFHLSKNLFKKSPDFNYQMITYRDYKSTFIDFNQRINDMKDKLLELNINFDKVEIEECIFDSNVNVDNNWF
jgi:hypothetical protein